MSRPHTGAPIGAEVEIFANGQIREDPPAFRYMDQATRRRSWTGAGARSRRQRKRMGTWEARMTPEMVRLSVDFPVPLEPSTATISPSPTVRSIPRRISVEPYRREARGSPGGHQA